MEHCEIIKPSFLTLIQCQFNLILNSCSEQKATTASLLCFLHSFPLCPTVCCYSQLNEYLAPISAPGRPRPSRNNSAGVPEKRWPGRGGGGGKRKSVEEGVVRVVVVVGGWRIQGIRGKIKKRGLRIISF